MKQIFVHGYITGVVALLVGGCSSSMEDYKETVKHGIKSIPHVQEIKEMFPDAPKDHFITHYGFEKSKPVVWNTVVYFGGKYELTYQIEVVIDYERNQVSKVVAEPKFRLLQVNRVYDASPETLGGYFDGDHKFGEADWNKILKAKGDFSIIGIQLDTNSPTLRFDDYVRGQRKPRVQVE